MMKRGELWWADLEDPVGSGPGFRRPVVVLQANALNRSRIATVIVATVTSNLALEAAPGNVRLRRRDSGLDRVSVVNVSQILTVDKGCLLEPLRQLPAGCMEQIGRGVRLVMGLGPTAG